MSPKEKKVSMVDHFRHKFVNDLGIAAYILMHGFVVIGKRGKSIYFDCSSPEEAASFDNLLLEYQPPSPFYTFDSCLMYLKKINETVPTQLDDDIHKCVTDLGVAAYILMHEYDEKRSLGAKVIGKRGRQVYFEHLPGKGVEFNRRSYEYLPSQFHTYDSNLMSLKKIGEYMP
jgi:hypothetical protein